MLLSHVLCVCAVALTGVTAQYIFGEGDFINLPNEAGLQAPVLTEDVLQTVPESEIVFINPALTEVGVPSLILPEGELETAPASEPETVKSKLSEVEVKSESVSQTELRNSASSDIQFKVTKQKDLKFKKLESRGEETNTTKIVCDPKVCVLPGCRCSGTDIPGGLTREETPQVSSNIVIFPNIHLYTFNSYLFLQLFFSLTSAFPKINQLSIGCFCPSS